jgi:transposase
VTTTWHANEAVRELYTHADADLALEWLERLVAEMADQDNPIEVRSLGRTLRRWKHQMVAWHHAHVSNGPTEAANNRIKRVKRAAFGFRSFRNYRIRPRESSRRPEPSVPSTLGVTKPTRRRREEIPVEEQQQYVGIDLHRRRSVIVGRNTAGQTLETVRIDNDPVALAAEVTKAGPHPEVILEATYGWYWAADVLKECGATVHLSHPLGNNWGNGRVKNDERDATDLVDLLRLGRLAEAWIAPPRLRELREFIRYRAKLVQLRSNLKAQVHSVLAKEGVAVPMTDLFGVGGHHLLDQVHLADAYRIRVESLRDLIGLFDREIAMLHKQIAPYFAGDLGFHAVQAIPGVGPVLASIFAAEIGDVSRFKSPRHLCSWAGLTPTHHESDERVRRGHITKQGSRLVRWAAVEAVARQRGDTPIRAHHLKVGERRGKQIGRVAAARKLLILVYYGSRRAISRPALSST